MARSQRDADREKEARRNAEIVFLTQLLRDPVGRDYFYNFIFLHCGVHASYLSHNLVQMAHLEGMRYVGTKLADELREASPDLYLQMLKEANHGRYTNNRSSPGRGDTAARNGTGSDDTAAIGFDDPAAG